MAKQSIKLNAKVKRDASRLTPASQAAYDAAVQLGTPAKVVSVNDSFSNPIARTGYNTQSLLEGTTYPMTRLTYNYGLLNSLYRSNWIVQNIISVIPEDMTKNWFKLTTNMPPDELDKFERMQRTTKLRDKVVEGMKWGRLYGGAVGLIVIDRQDNLEEPLDLDLVMPDSFKGLYIVDRWSGVYPDFELISDIHDPDFGYPKYYLIRNPDGAEVARVHYSRVVRFVGRRLPLYERIQELYWGQSEVEAIYEEIVKRDNISHNMANLTFKASLSVYTVKNLTNLLALSDTESAKRLYNVIQNQSVLESNQGIRLIDSDDKLEHLNYNFAGLSDVYTAALMDVSGAARIPMTRLFGRSPTGLNATGESDLQNYYDYIDEVRESDFRPIIDRLLPIMAMSAWGYIPDDLNYTFESIRTQTDEQRAKTAYTDVNTLTEAFKNNGLTLEAYMRELKNLSDTTGLFSAITDEMIDGAANKYYSDIQMGMNDPLADLSSFTKGSTEEESSDE